MVSVDQLISALHSENWKLCKFRSRSLEIDVLRQGLPIGRDRSYFSCFELKVKMHQIPFRYFKYNPGVGRPLSLHENDAKLFLADQ